MLVFMYVDASVLSESGWQANHPFTIDVMTKPSVLAGSVGVGVVEVAGVVAVLFALFWLQAKLVEACESLVDCLGIGGSDTATEAAEVSATSAKRRLGGTALFVVVLLLVPLPFNPPSYRPPPDSPPTVTNLQHVPPTHAARPDDRPFGQAGFDYPQYLVSATDEYTTAEEMHLILSGRSGNAWFDGLRQRPCSLRDAMAEAPRIQPEMGERTCYPRLEDSDVPHVTDRSSIMLVISDSLRTDGRAYMPHMQQFQKEYPDRTLRADVMIADAPTSDGAAFSLLYSLGDAMRHIMQSHNRSAEERDPAHDWDFTLPVALQVLKGNG